jgi:hypothetical protein
MFDVARHFLECYHRASSQLYILFLSLPAKMGDPIDQSYFG